MSLIDTFSKLKSTVLKTKTANIDLDLDKSVEKILRLKSSGSGLATRELFKYLNANKNFKLDTFSMFSQATRPEYFGQTDRIQRYLVYESIVRNITYAYRALNVIVDNIIAPDDITKRTLDVRPNSSLGKEPKLISFIGTEDSLPLWV